MAILALLVSYYPYGSPLKLVRTQTPGPVQALGIANFTSFREFLTQPHGVSFLALYSATDSGGHLSRLLEPFLYSSVFQHLVLQIPDFSYFLNSDFCPLNLVFCNMSGLSLPVLWPKKCLQAESRGNHKIPLCVASFSLLLRDHILVPSIVQCLTIVEVSLLLIVLLKLSQILSVGTPSRWFFFMSF